MAESYYKQGDMTVNKIDSEIGVLKMTFYKYIRHRKVKIGSYFHQNDSKSQVVDIQYVMFCKISKIEISSI